jgi:hypothetical protein
VRIVAGIGRAGDADEAARSAATGSSAWRRPALPWRRPTSSSTSRAADGTAALLHTPATRWRPRARRRHDGSGHGHGAAARRSCPGVRPCCTAANFSIGVNLLLARGAAAAVLGADAYDIEIVEAHHGGKVDAPSGTALALGEAVAGARVALESVRRDGRSGHTGARPTGEIGMHAVRGGGVIGEHQLMFLGGRERIELRHEALDRSLFAEVRWRRPLAGRPAAGRYGMRDVLGL